MVRPMRHDLHIFFAECRASRALRHIRPCSERFRLPVEACGLVGRPEESSRTRTLE